MRNGSSPGERYLLGTTGASSTWSDSERQLTGGHHTPADDGGDVGRSAVFDAFPRAAAQDQKIRTHAGLDPAGDRAEADRRSGIGGRGAQRGLRGNAEHLGHAGHLGHLSPNSTKYPLASVASTNRTPTRAAARKRSSRLATSAAAFSRASALAEALPCAMISLIS